MHRPVFHGAADTEKYRHEPPQPHEWHFNATQLWLQLRADVQQQIAALPPLGEE